MSGEILDRIDAVVGGMCPCGAEPAAGSAWCSEDCRPVPGAGLPYGGAAAREATVRPAQTYAEAAGERHQWHTHIDLGGLEHYRQRFMLGVSPTIPLGRSRPVREVVAGTDGRLVADEMRQPAAWTDVGYTDAEVFVGEVAYLGPLTLWQRRVIARMYTTERRWPISEA